MSAALAAPVETVGAAALPMYDWPEVQDAADAFWRAWRTRLAARGVAAPERLARERSMESVWRDPDLLVAQTCGAPFVDGRAGSSVLVTTPCSTAPGCAGPTYRSWVVVRRDSPVRALAALAGRRAAVNDQGSLSGWYAINAAGITPGDVLVTGAHRNSARAVAEERAEFAAIDATAWALFQRHEPEASAALRVVGGSPAFAAPPLICAPARSPQTRVALRDSFDETCADPGLRTVCDALFLGGSAQLSVADYAPIRALISA